MKKANNKNPRKTFVDFLFVFCVLCETYYLKKSRFTANLIKISDRFFCNKKVLGTLVVIQHRSGNQAADYFKATSRHIKDFA